MNYESGILEAVRCSDDLKQGKGFEVWYGLKLFAPVKSNNEY